MQSPQFICANDLCYCLTDITYPFACYVISFLIWQHDSESVGNLLIILFSYRGCLGGWSFCRWQGREEYQHYCCDCERVRNRIVFNFAACEVSCQSWSINLYLHVYTWDRWWQLILRESNTIRLCYDNSPFLARS